MKKFYIIVFIIFLPNISLACHGSGHYGNYTDNSFKKLNHSSYSLKLRCGGYAGNNFTRDVCYSY